MPGLAEEFRPMCLVRCRDNCASTEKQLVSGDFLQFDAFKQSRSVVLSGVVRGRGFLEKLLSIDCVKIRQKILRPIGTAVGVGTGLAASHRNAMVDTHTDHVGKKTQGSRIGAKR